MKKSLIFLLVIMFWDLFRVLPKSLYLSSLLDPSLMDRYTCEIATNKKSIKIDLANGKWIRKMLRRGKKTEMTKCKPRNHSFMVTCRIHGRIERSIGEHFKHAHHSIDLFHSRKWLHFRELEFQSAKNKSKWTLVSVGRLCSLPTKEICSLHHKWHLSNDP